MEKLKVQAQHLQKGDLVGSGEEVVGVTVNSIYWPSNKVQVTLKRNDILTRSPLWGKYTLINIRRP